MTAFEILLYTIDKIIAVAIGIGIGVILLALYRLFTSIRDKDMDEPI